MRNTRENQENRRHGRMRAPTPGIAGKEMIMNGFTPLQRVFALLLVLFALPLLAGCGSVTVTHELGSEELKLLEGAVSALYTQDGKTLADVLATCANEGSTCPDFDGLELVQNEDGSVSLCDSDGNCHVECKRANWRPNGCNCSNKPHRRQGTDGDTGNNGNGRSTTWVKYPGGRPRQPAQPAQNPPVQVASGDSSATGTGTGTGTGGSAWASGTGGQGGSSTATGGEGGQGGQGGQGGNATATGGQAWASGGSASIGDTSASGGNAWQHQQQDAHAEAMAYANSSLTIGDVLVFLEIDVPQPEINLTVEGNTVNVQIDLPRGMSIEECNWCDLYVRYRLSCLEHGDCVAAVLQYLLDRCLEQANNPPTAVPTNPGQPTAIPTSPPQPTAVPTNPPPTAVPSETPRPTLPIPTAVPTNPPPTAVTCPWPGGFIAYGCEPSEGVTCEQDYKVPATSARIGRVHYELRVNHAGKQNDFLRVNQSFVAPGATVTGGSYFDPDRPNLRVYAQTGGFLYCVDMLRGGNTAEEFLAGESIKTAKSRLNIDILWVAGKVPTCVNGAGFGDHPRARAECR